MTATDEPRNKRNGSGKNGWTKEDLVVFGLVVRMLEIDPTLQRLENVLRKGAKLVHRLRATERKVGHE